MNEPLSVALVSTERRWQGGEEQGCQLAHGLRRRGHQCRIIAVRDRPFAARMEADGFPVLAMRGKRPTPGRCWLIRRALRRWAVDVVHFNDAHSVTIGGLAAWRLPGVRTFAARRAAFPLRSPARYRLLCDGIICVSRAAADMCAAAGIPRPRLRVVWSGVDPARVARGDAVRGRRVLGGRAGDPQLLAVGSLIPCKGHRHLIDALPHVHQHFPQARLAIAGSGPLEAELRGQIARLGLAARAQLLGFREDIPDLVQACDLFVFPSLTEGLGSSLIDAMLAARPIVTTLAGGIPDLVFPDSQPDRPVAWTAEAGDPRSLANAIVSALAAPDQSALLARQARQHAIGHFTMDHMVDETLRVYLEP